METELFTWSDWDGSQECMIFYNPVLVKQIGKWPIGTTFDSAILDNEKGILQFEHKHKVIAQYKLHLTVGEEVVD